jgi:hypothetical protein
MTRSLLALLVVLAVAIRPASAQGGPRHEFVVAPNRAMSVTRAVLVNQGFEIVRVQTVGNDRVVYYRRGNMGNGKGAGRPMKLIIRRTGNRVVFVDTPTVILTDIDVKLKS